ncbi:ABC transporter ATP-binding protein [Actinoplanes lobatus]|uniref:ABC transporter ATP-binding protein n=1 Tax=Actinoplanes lobatus TaxID=113568 RepID=A0A7W7HJ73_9ACTN|nr:ATP-binding cassette domain-containing protein [Actinoplanes lobatus]MBB4751162.1 branched-chain amino acid transport system ATP-binding protein [Actinoplanes lobatus]GGN94651.1 ABC transporter ATP-binding protein [Actinoplanes lobatus]GIE44657.1 ABC transporter ATP-binding protein [Actinoplanes lobatus]
MTAALEVRDIGKRFGALTVLDRVSFSVTAGEAVGVVGPNGAGKTTLLDIVAGVRRRDRGRVLLGGADVTGLPPERRCRLGLARTFQVPRPMGDLTVFETALLAAVRGGGLHGRRAEQAAIRALETAGLLADGDRRSTGLRLLSRKRLELARAVAAGPRVLLLDEIAGGLTDAETGALVGTIGDLAAAGIAIVWVEHVIRALVRVATRLVCLADGRVLADGEPRAVLGDPAVQRAYFGRAAP